MLKGAQSSSTHFERDEDVVRCLHDSSVVSNELLAETARALIREWSSRYRDRKQIACGVQTPCEACHGCGGVHHVPMTTFEWAMGCDNPGHRFDLWRAMHSHVAEESFAVVPKKLNLVTKNVKYALARLLRELRLRGLVVGSREEEEAEPECVHEAHFLRVCEVVTACYHICVEELRVRVNLPDAPRPSVGGGEGGEQDEEETWALYDAVSEEQKLTRKHLDTVDPKEMTPFQSLHDHLLKLLQQRGYRKSGDLLYQPVFSSGRRTGAWQLAYPPPAPASTFEAFFQENISRRLDFDYYLDATSSYRNRDEVLKQLKHEEEVECPTLVFNRLFISFNNAIVHMLGAVFPLDQPEAWQDIADRKNAQWSALAARSAARLAASGVPVAPYDLAARTMEDTGEDMRIRPPTREDATIRFIDEAVPEELFDTPFDASLSSFPSSDAEAYDPAEPWDSGLFDYLDDMHTPHFDSVQHTQQWDRATRFWDLASMARAFFPGRTLEDGHYFPFHQGRAGTGKSLKLQVLQSYFPQERLGVLSSMEGEKTFWGYGMQNKWSVFWLEVQNKGRPPIDRGTLQQIVGMERTNLPQKGGEAVSWPWRAHLFASGNEYFNYEDSSGSLRRRTMTFLYDHVPTQRDPTLETKIRSQRAALLLKMLRSYHLQLLLFPGMDWQHQMARSSDGARVPIIGEQMADYHRRAIENLDPLQAFVSQPHAFDFGEGIKMSEKEFVDDYNAYRKNIGHSDRAKWTQGHYQIVFESFSITRGTSELQDPATGAYKSAPCLFGIAPKQADDVLM